MAGFYDPSPRSESSANAPHRCAAPALSGRALSANRYSRNESNDSEFRRQRERERERERAIRANAEFDSRGEAIRSKLGDSLTRCTLIFHEIFHEQTEIIREQIERIETRVCKLHPAAKKIPNARKFGIAALTRAHIA